MTGTALGSGTAAASPSAATAPKPTQPTQAQMDAAKAHASQQSVVAPDGAVVAAKNLVDHKIATADMRADKNAQVAAESSTGPKVSQSRAHGNLPAQSIAKRYQRLGLPARLVQQLGTGRYQPVRGFTPPTARTAKHASVVKHLNRKHVARRHQRSRRHHVVRRHRIRRSSRTSTSGTSGSLLPSTGATISPITSTATTGSISGTIIDSATSLPVPDACALAFPNEGDGGYGGAAVTACTDGSGHYTISGLKAGSYIVEFQDHAHSHLTTFFGGDSQPTSVIVDAGATSTADVAMVLGGSASGHVQNANGDPIANVCVTLYPTGSDTNFYPGGCTDSSGNFQTTGGAPGVYKAYFSPESTPYKGQFYAGTTDYNAAQDVTLSLGNVTTGIDATLARGGTISGTITNSDGDPLQGICGEVDSLQYDEWDWAGDLICSDSAGHYSSTGLETGTYLVRFYDYSGHYFGQFLGGGQTTSTATRVDVVDGADTGGQDVVLTRAGTISGTVTDSATGDPIQGVCAMAYSPIVDDYVGTGGCTDSSGNYTIGGLTTDSYKVQFNDYSGIGYVNTWYGGVTQADGTSVDVTTGQDSPNVNVGMVLGGRISGTVTDLATGNPIPASVVVMDGDNFVGYADAYNGAYTVVGLPAGNYQVEFTASGHVEQWFNSKATQALADNVSVSLGVETTGIDAALHRSGEITGTVTAQDTGLPLQGVCVESDDFNYEDCTDANGAYHLTDLPDGNYVVHFDGVDSGYHDQWYDHAATVDAATPVPAAEDTITSNIDASLAPLGSVSGTITDVATSQPLNGDTDEACVTLYDQDQNWISNACANNDGTYKVRGVPAGTYVVGFSADAYVSQYWQNADTFGSATTIQVTDGVDTSGIDAAMKLGGVISGTITDSASGLPLTGDNNNACVSVYSANSDNSSYGCADDTGVFHVRGLASGSYVVDFSASGYIEQYYSGAATYDAATPVNVTVGETTSGIDAALVVGSKITGTITDADTGNPIDGYSLDACVRVYTSDFNNEWDSCADDLGNYTVDGLAPGTYLVRFEVDGYVSQYWQNATTAEAATPVDVGASTTVSGIDAAMTRGGSISGTVRDKHSSDGSLNPDSYIEVTAYTPAGDYAGSTEVDTYDNNSYFLDGLAPGQYIVEFEDYDGYYSPQYWDHKQSMDTADQVSVTAGATTTGIDADLSDGGSISGLITDATSGDPIAGACANVFQASDTYNAVRTGCADETGHYTVSGLATGTYLVEFIDQNGPHQPQWASGKSSSASADFIQVTFDQTTTGVDAAMELGGTISGTVTDAASGDPLSGECPAVYSQYGGYITSICTDANGHYRTMGLAPGQYTVEFYGDSTVGYVTQWFDNKPNQNTADVITITGIEDHPSTDAAMVIGGRITGHVTDTNGDPVADDCWVDVYDSTGNFVDSECTDENGQWTSTGLYGGNYQIRFGFNGYAIQWFNNALTQADADPVEVTLGQVTSNVDAVLSGGTGSISGTVTDAATGDPIPGTCALIYGGPDSDYACTDDTGKYQSSHLRAGDYYVDFAYNDDSPYIADYYGDANGTQSPTRVHVDQTPITGIDDALTRGGTIGGTIRSAGTGEPLSNICVEAIDANGSEASWTCTYNGTYRTRGLRAGSYKLAFSNSGGRYLSQWYDGVTTEADATPVPVDLGQAVAGIDVNMVLGASISGHITDADTGLGVANACVSFHDSVTDASTGSVACSSSDGSYSATIPAGSYKVEFVDGSGDHLNQWWNGKPDEASADVLTVASGDVRGDINAVLGKLSTAITGTVTDSNGNPLPGVCEYLYSQAGSFAGVGTCANSSGQFELKGMPAGDYKVAYFDPAGTYKTSWSNNKPDQASADTITVNLNDHLTVDPQIMDSVTSISGTIVDSVSSTPLNDVCAYLYDANSGNYAGEGSCTDPQGHYVLSGMAAGSYKLGFFDPSGGHVTRWSGNSPDEAGAAVVTIADGDAVTGQDAQLAPLTTVAGRVTDSVTTNGVPNVCVYLYDSSTQAPVGTGSCTGSDGRYRMSVPGAGSYKVAFFDTAGTHDTGWWSGASDAVSATVLTLTDGQHRTGLDEVMTAETSVSGTITDDTTGQPLSGACAYLYDAGTGNYSGYGTCADVSGHYTLAGMPAGDYVLGVFDPTASHRTTWYGDVAKKANATTISLGSGTQATGDDVALPELGQITGQVTNSVGDPRNDVCVYADDLDGNYVGVGGCTDSNGNYSLNGLAPGQYKLGFYPPGQDSPTPYWYGGTTEAGATPVTVTAGQTTPSIDREV